MTRSFDQGEPIKWLPYAPFVAILPLVLLVWTATWPRPTHALVIDLPIAESYPPPPGVVKPHVDRITVSPDGQTRLNGKFVSPDRLAVVFARLASEDRWLIVVYEPDQDTRYEDVLHTLNELRLAGLTQRDFCFGGLHQHRHFGLQSSANEFVGTIKTDASFQVALDMDIAPHGCALWTDELPDWNEV